MRLSICRSYRFYAAHRNEEVGGKCGNIHGHEYRLTVNVCHQRNGSVTILFDEIDAIIDPIIKKLDHSLLLSDGDSKARILAESGACNKVYWMRVETSVENLACHLFKLIRDCGLRVVKLTLQETNSGSCVIEEDQDDQ